MIDTIETIETSEAPSLASFPSVEQTPSARSANASAPSGFARAISFAVPDSDLGRFASLPESARADLRRSFFALQSIHACRDNIGIQAACRIQAAKCNHARGFTAASLCRKYYNFLAADWTSLVNKALAGPDWWNTDDKAGLPDEFVQFWRALCERNQRKCKPAHRELLRIWRTGQDSENRTYKSIPGYPASPLPAARCPLPPAPDAFTGVPKGWSYENLQRNISDDFSLAAARQGLVAASQHARKIFKTRAGLQVGEFILFDDQEYDLRLNFLGRSGQSTQRRAMRPLGLNALDLFSADSFAYGLKPTLVGDDGAKQKLKEIDMMWFVVHVLTAFGFNVERGTTFVVEHGTAAIRSDFEERIHLVTGGKVTVDRSGIHNKPAIAALFEGASKGNPRFKAPLESFFNLVRNEMAMIPGQVGKDRDHCPEELHGRERENERLLKAMDLLPPDQARQLKLPVWSWPQFLLFAMEVYRRINGRTDHELEGWEKAGLVANEWRLSPELPWMAADKFLALPAEQQQALVPFIQNAPELRRVRRLSPHEVFSAGATRLQKVSNCLLPDLLGPDFGVIRTVRDGYIEITDQEIDTDKMRFNAWGARGPNPNPNRNPNLSPLPAPQGEGQGEGQINIPNGTDLRCYLNPFNPSVLVVADAKDNRFIAELPRQDIPTWSDVQGIERQLGAARKEQSERLQQLGVRHVDRARERVRDTTHNNDVLAGRPVTPAQHEAVRRIMSEPDDFTALGSAGVSPAVEGVSPETFSELSAPSAVKPSYAVSMEELSQL